MNLIPIFLDLSTTVYLNTPEFLVAAARKSLIHIVYDLIYYMMHPVNDDHYLFTVALIL